ncbi:MAG TPA: hypothetical protein VII56_08850 [Rhizomicrobium sp.]
MSDSVPQSSVPAVPSTDTRTLAIIVYGLYLGAVFTCGAAGIAGVVLAYIKRDEARGTVWESHFENAIHAFWVWFMLMAIGVATVWLFIGLFVMAAAFVYFLYRTIKGLIGAIDSKPYV